MTEAVLVFGTGSIGRRHLSVLQSAGIRVLVLPKTRNRAAELKVAGLEVVSSPAEAAEAGAVAAIVATDTAAHADDARDAMKSGLPVLIEKPIAPTAAQARPIGELAGKLARPVFVGCTLRFSESLGAFRQWLPRLGAIHAVRIECQSYLPDWRPTRDYRESYSARSSEGGVLRDLIHEIDYAAWIFGWPSAVQARLGNHGRLGIEAEEAADLFWHSPSGSAVSIRLDYLSRPPRRVLHAFGEHGDLVWDGVAQTVHWRSVAGQTEGIRSIQTRDEMLLSQNINFLAVCRGGKTGDLATYEDGLRALAICDAARLGSETRREEMVA